MKLSFTVLLFLIGLSDSFSQDGLLKTHPQLAYWKLGDQSDVVIVLHGGPAVQHEYLRPEFDGLTKSATVIYYDQRGCGKSERADSYTWQDHVKDLHRLINTVAPKKKVFLAGSSWGSLLAILYTYSYPVKIKGVILTGTIKWLGQGLPYIRESDFVYNNPHKQPLYEKSLVKTVGADKPDTINISKMIEAQSGIQHSEPVASLISAPIPDSLSRIRTPILLFNGSHSRKFDWVDNYMTLLPQTELHTFEAAGHDPWFSDPVRFSEYCNTFISKHK